MTKLRVIGADYASLPERSQTLQEILDAEDPGASPRGSSYHKTLMICPREFVLAYVHGLRPIRPHEALIVGWLWHYCLQRYYEAIQEHQRSNPNRPSDSAWLWGGCNEGMKRAYGTLDQIEAAQAGYGDIAKQTRAMLDVYFDTYGGRDRWRIIAVEETLIYMGPFDYSCRLDVVVEDFERGGMLIVEHKTAKWLTRDLIDNYQLDLQILGEVWCLERCIDLKSYPPFFGVVVIIATKDSPKCTRVSVCPSRDHLMAFEQNVARYKTLRRVQERLGYPQYFGHCAGAHRGYSACQFYDLCHSFPMRTIEEWSAMAKDDPPEGYFVKPPAPLEKETLQLVRRKA